MNKLDYKKLPKKPAIYKIINTVNNKFYIGSAVNVQTRIRRHLYELNSGTHNNCYLKRSYDKYGIKSFEIELLEVFESIKYERLLEIEISYIKSLDALSNGYNLMIDNRSHFIGWNKTEKCISANKKRCSKPIFMFDRITGKFISEFESISEAARQIGDSSSNISGCCKGRLNFVKNYVFCYKSDYDKTKTYKYKSHWATGIKKSEANRLKIKASVQRNFGKNTHKYDKDFNFICSYPSMREAEKLNGLKLESLRRRIDSNKIYEEYYWYSKLIK